MNVVEEYLEYWKKQICANYEVIYLRNLSNLL